MVEKKGQSAARWMDFIAEAVDAPLHDLKDQVEDRSSWGKSV